MSKNILHLMGMDSTKYGGIERFNVELSRQLREKGYHSVFVYEEYPCVQQFVDDLKETGAELYIINSRKKVLKFCWDIWKLYKQYNFCTIHAHFTKARFYALPLAALYGIRNILYTFHSSIDQLDKFKLHTRLWYYWMNKKCRIITVSKQIARTAKSNWKNINIKTLYLGVSQNIVNTYESRHNLDIPSNQLVLTCIANFNHIKGLDVLVKAIKILVHEKALKNIKLYIIGQTPKDKIELQQLIESLKISSYVNLEGIKNNVQQYLSASDIYIQPSRSEGIGLAIMEACATGLPVIASRVGGIPEVAIEDKNALLFESENVNDLAEKISQLVEDSELRLLLSTQSNNVYNEYFSIQSNVAQLIEYYNLE